MSESTLGETRHRLLLVDDDAVMRRSAGRFLERAGFDVHGAPSGPAALAWIEQGERFDVAVLDLQMPEMSGAELLLELTRQVPEMPAGIWSASPSLAELDPDVQRNAAFMVSKTNRVTDLVDAVRRALAEGPPSREARDRSWGLSTGVRRRSGMSKTPIGDVGS